MEFQNAGITRDKGDGFPIRNYKVELVDGFSETQSLFNQVINLLLANLMQLEKVLQW